MQFSPVILCNFAPVLTLVRPSALVPRRNLFELTVNVAEPNKSACGDRATPKIGCQLRRKL